MEVFFSLFWVMDSGGLMLVVRNLYFIGVKIIDIILVDWFLMFKNGINLDNYVGDIFGLLGGNFDFVLDNIISVGSVCSVNKFLVIQFIVVVNM